MKTLNIFLLFASILCTASCVFEEQSSNLQEAVVTVSQKGISPDIVDLSAEDARTVASIFTEEYGTKAGAAKAVGDVIEIKNADGQVTMYVVNFTNDNGYIVVSATKKFYPVLVEVEKGCFDKNVYKTGAEVLLEEYKADIAYFKALPEDSTVRFRQMWRQYEKQQANNIYSCMTKSGNDDLMNLVPGSVAQWISEGYEVYSLSEAENCGLPSTIYNQWYNIARNEAHPNYDFEENSFIIKRIEETSSQHGPFLTTQWDQDPPYNKTVALHYGDTVKVGCTAVAVGQIMKYHEWPTSFLWSSMPNTLSSGISGTTILSDFLYNVGLSCDTNYYEGDWASDIFNARDAFLHYGFCCSNVVAHNAVSVFNNLINDYPVLMNGTKPNSDDFGHIWVCDGATRITSSIVYELKVISIYHNPLMFITPCDNYSVYQGDYYNLHMNFGWGGRGDGWYIDNVLPNTVPYSGDRYNLEQIHVNQNFE